jgi:benzodiazapine receptor
MKVLKLTILFLVINFSALAIGSWLMNNGPISEWYVQLNKAPWTPDGWVFGVAWTTIMICFSVYLAYAFKDYNSKSLKLLFAIQVFLNVVWNYAFFNQHQIGLGLLIIVLLTIVVFYFFFKFNIKTFKYLLLPYMVWLCLATSLNAYILLYN